MPVAGSIAPLEVDRTLDPGQSADPGLEELEDEHVAVLGRVQVLRGVDERVVEDDELALRPGGALAPHLGLYPTATLQYSSTTLYQFYYHIR